MKKIFLLIGILSFFLVFTSYSSAKLNKRNDINYSWCYYDLVDPQNDINSYDISTDAPDPNGYPGTTYLLWIRIYDTDFDFDIDQDDFDVVFHLIDGHRGGSQNANLNDEAEDNITFGKSD